MVAQQDQQEVFEIYAANNIYNGKDGDEIGFIASSSVTSSDTTFWTNAANSFFPAQSTVSGYTNFSGSYQEIRYYKETLTEGIFKDYTMNPNSIEGLTPSSSADQLVFRAP